MTAGTGRAVAARPVPRTALRDRLDAGTALDVLVLGGGCAGLALAVALDAAGAATVVAEAAPDDVDGRTWCAWDDGASLVPEAASRSWTRWEVRAPSGRAVATDPQHPYRMVRAGDYRAAARWRIEAGGRSRVVHGARVTAATDLPEGVPVVDARGPAPAAPLPRGRVLLQQRFAGRWIRAARPVFDPDVVTLMDFEPGGDDEAVRFLYVLPVEPDLALVECTVFARSARDGGGLLDEVDAYLGRRWGLRPGEWRVEGEETGCIPMTDAPPPPPAAGPVLFGLRAGIARASSGYAFGRIQRAARLAAPALAAGRRPPMQCDRRRTRVLDAVFLRFLRDRPGAAPDVFVRLFRLPGPLVVRFLTERSSLRDDLRIVLALPKRPFLAAAAVALLERAGLRR